MTFDARTEIVKYLDERIKCLIEERRGLENMYDTFPPFVWDRVNQIMSEITRIGRILEVI